MINGRPLGKWLEYGAEKEDAPACRASNHFHNPYLPWQDSGLSDTWWLTDLWCWGLGLGQYPPDNIRSNITWATGAIGDRNFDMNSVTFNEWDWISAREYFYTYLTGRNLSGDTVAHDQESRDTYLVNTLRALGQVMHLLQDMAVPAHVRNDFSQGHTMAPPGPEMPWKWIGNGFEKYVERNDGRDWFAQDPIGPNFNNMRITHLWDTDLLTTSLAPTGSTGLGLAEYTSMNFLSEYSMFNPDCPYPKPEHCVVVASAPPLDTNTPLSRQYLASVNGHPGEQVHHLAVVSYTEYYQKVYFPNVGSEKLPLWMDDNCYNEYGKKLIPRAVGYSAALLDYFFRGQLATKSMTVSHGPGFSISGLKLEVKNATPPVSGQLAADRMESGQLDLAYHYFNPNTNTWEGNVATNVYSVSSAADPINSGFVTIDAVFPQFIPFGAKQISFMLVFSGKLGHEQEAVIGAPVETNTPSRIAYHHQPGGVPNNAIDIHIVLPDGRDDRIITDSNGVNRWYSSPAWSPVEGKALLAYVFESCQDCEGWDQLRVIVLNDLAANQPPVLLPARVIVDSPPAQYDENEWGRFMLTPSFSRDGTRLSAINWAKPGILEAIATIELNDSCWQWINDYNFWSKIVFAGCGVPRWSPVADEIAFGVARQPDPATGLMMDKNDIFLISADGSHYRAVTEDTYRNFMPAWSPDGQWLVFVSDADGNGVYDLWIMDRSGNQKQKLLECATDCADPTFSPNGAQIAFSRDDNIHVMSLLGKDSQQITHSGYITSRPNWSPALAPPKVSFTSSPRTITAGETATLSWQSSDADSAELNEGIGNVDPNGSIQVSPEATTTYTLTVLGLGGYAEASVTIVVE